LAPCHSVTNYYLLFGLSGRTREEMSQVSHPIEIPAEDITRQYLDIQDEVTAAILEILPTGKFVLGPKLAAFETEFAAYCETRYCLGISSGTAALHLALAGLGVGPGDEVITVPNTYAATVFAISYVGATPVFVDVDPITFNMDPNQIEARITPRTKVLLPVHLYGHPVDMDPILEIARRHGLSVVEDDAHAHGALYKGRKVGSLGDVGCFSFYPRKVMGAYGDGGAVTLSDPEIFDRIKMLRYMGQHKKYVHEVVGYQQRLADIQAAVLRVKLKYLEDAIAMRRQWAALYTELLQGLPVITPREVGDVRHVFYMYVIRTPHRDEIIPFMADRGIEVQYMYPIEVPYLPAYEYLGYKAGDFPVADAHVTDILCLPMFPELREDEVRRVAASLWEFFSERGEADIADVPAAIVPA
jgi:dTDP-4-amino-4,6-dideoxygalactose transaminase